MKKAFSTALWILVFGLTAVCTAEPAYREVEQLPGQAVIYLNEGILPQVTKAADGISVDVPSLQAVAKQHSVTNMYQLYDFLGAPKKAGDTDFRLVWVVEFPESVPVESVRRAYEAAPEVSSTEPVEIYKLLSFPNDIDPNQWYLRNMNLGQKDVRAVGGWAESIGDSNIVIAVLDTGVDWRHPDLGGSGPDYARGAIWMNWPEYHGTPGVDDDGNGQIDDLRGWDFVNVSDQGGGDDYGPPDNDPIDFNGHGTLVSGCTAPITDNGEGIAGTAWGSKIMAVRIGFTNSEGEGVTFSTIMSQGILYAADNGAQILNHSYSSGSGLAFAVNQALQQGVIIVNSAGNDGEDIPYYLGTYPEVMSVAATNQGDAKTSFSNYGSWVEISAPGVDIFTTAYNPNGEVHYYASTQGTSFSAPITAGACALVWAANPGWDRTQVMNHLMDTCDDIDAINPLYVGQLGAGRINLLVALGGDDFHKVPDEFPLMLDAMNESRDGDTVAVLASEVVPGPLTIIAKELNILGGYEADYLSRDPVANPTTVFTSTNSPAMQFQGNTVETTVVDGFSCSGGSGTIFASPILGRYGGGILMNQVSPTLRNIQVMNNSVGSMSEFGGGGGIAMFQSSAVLENVDVWNNEAIHGAGVFIYQGAPTLIGCDIYDNTSLTDNLGYMPYGGGLYISEADVTLQNCRISGHMDLESGGGIYATKGAGSASLNMQDNEIYNNLMSNKGGGMYADCNDVTMLRDTIYDNGYNPTAGFSNGGGMYILTTTAQIDSITCQNNVAHAGAGALIDSGDTVDVMTSLFTGNDASFFGGGLVYQNITTGSLIGNTVAVNSAAATGAAGIQISNSSPTVANNISTLNTGGTFNANGIHVSNGTPIFSCNDVYGNEGSNYTGVTDPTGTDGNISEDPQFCDTMNDNFHVDTTSPCAPENSGGCGLIGALHASCISDPVPEEDGRVPTAFLVDQNFPNPFNPLTTIRFALPQSGFTSVRVFDLSGRLVKTVLAEELEANSYEVTWDGRDTDGQVVAAGIYFYRVDSGEDSFTGRMALVK